MLGNYIENLEEIVLKNVLVLVALTLLSSGGYSQEVPRASWISHMESLFPAHMCREGQYFRDCFEVTASECNQSLTDLVSTCMQQYEDQIPEVLNQPQDGTKWGGIVGGCAGSLYDLDNKAAKKDTAKCNDPTAWQ